MQPPDETRDAIIAAIEAAFADVTRGEHAISWSETVAIDDHASDDACLAARESDTDTHWTQLVDDPNWDPFPGIGGFAFMSVEGFAYYLPPTMVRFLRGDISECFPGQLLSFIDRLVVRTENFRWTRSRKECIARFIAYMAATDPECTSEKCSENPWKAALDRGWSGHLPTS